MLSSTTNLDGRLSGALDDAGVIGSSFRDELTRDLKAKVLLRDGRDVVEVLGPRGCGRHVVAAAVHAAASDLLGRDGQRVDVDCGALARAGSFSSGLAQAAQEAEGGTLVLDHLDGLDESRHQMLTTVMEQAGENTLIVALRDEASTPTVRRRASTRIRIKPLHQRAEDVWELVDHFFGATAAEVGLTQCRGFSRQAKADLTEAVQETGLASVRRLREAVRDLTFEAAAAESEPLKITSDMTRPYLELHFAQTQASRAAHEAALVESQLDAVLSPSMLDRLSMLHGVPPDVLERQAQVIGDLIETVHDVPRSYRNIMDRTDDIVRAALWLKSGAGTQAEFRRYFGEERFMRPTKSVAWAFYNRVFKRDM